MNAKLCKWTTPVWLTALLAVSACVAPGDFCTVVRGPIEFAPETAEVVVRTDRPAAEAIAAQNEYWRGVCL